MGVSHSALLQRRPPSRSHALKGHRIPAQGATLGIHPVKQPRVLKERRIGRLSERFVGSFEFAGCEAMRPHRPTRTSALPGPTVASCRFSSISAFSFPNFRFSSVAGVADPGRGAERLTERLLSRQTLGKGSRGAAEHAEKIQTSSLRGLRELRASA